MASPTFPEPCSVLFPDFQGLPEVEDGPVMFRPAPLGGHIRLLQYNRFLSNRFREYGPFNRFIDKSKLLTDLLLNDLYDKDRYFIVLKNSIMGTVEEDRFFFDDFIFPNQGMDCDVVPEAAPAA